VAARQVGINAPGLSRTVAATIGVQLTRLRVTGLTYNG